MLTSLPYQYPKSKKRALVVENNLYKNKRKKRQQDPTILPPITVNQTSPLISLNTSDQVTLNTFPKNDIQMTDCEMDANLKINPTVSKYCERIENVDQYLNEDINDNTNNSTTTYPNENNNIYSVFYQQKPIVATVVNGTLLPMEKKQGEDKLRIPEFVLRASPSSFPDGMSFPMNNNNNNNINNLFNYEKCDPMLMDID
ncbi:hypothetical protein BJ944DRAFT_94941 [Cunninghamella echinulata]|nr:hypothetical protein BJ944DRAFT_94941 [Cunninghamella echinulata]